jgi:hypothetical protein
MSNIRYELTNDAVRFDIRETKPDFVEDHYWSETIYWSRPPEFPTLSAPTSKEVYGGREVFWLPKLNRWIAFVWTSHMERGAGPLDESCHGPFSFSHRPPEDAQVAEAERAGKLIQLML